MECEMAEKRREALIIRMGRAVSRVSGTYAKAEKLMGLNPYLTKVLYALSFEGSITQSEICDAYEMPKQTVNNIAKRLIEKGLAEIRCGDTNHKNKPIALTEDGVAFADHVLTPMLLFEKRVLSDMGEESYERLIALLEQEADSIEWALAQGDLREEAACGIEER
ncbi:hypothetical protein C2L80_04605 [Rubneribacter badeniensis]|uniref:HTH marR-type domain-containing protein n=1 Tax=Rubneribacter badeniensis TaxID=2070688 RepID=A0A2K2U6I0_9ACTN|nr:MarR family transcriptional regulator [Rubneribacter badeniensis]OUO93162.1 hypothetical protein B5F41_09530 [Gordonibacter sp. An232A]PNV65818.1 hypothetical protein C2L80_04605 [Rubneribacter badeniensis]CVH76723.1 MarR family protein [Coriobacteriaceae bacterium CHKCI002]